MTHYADDNERKPIALGHLNDSGDLKYLIKPLVHVTQKLLGVFKDHILDIIKYTKNVNLPSLFT